MALTDAQKLQIISTNSVAANFDTSYSQTNREWFVRHMIQHYVSNGIVDANIESTVSSFIQTCKNIVLTKKNFTISIAFSATILRITLNRRVQIIYGALAAKPDLAQTANSNFLDFIIKRRFRSVMRMDYFVNPNTQGYFRYPSSCSTAAVGNQYKVNNDATPFWTPFVYAGDLFFKITTGPPVGPPSGAVLSIEKLFTRKGRPCEGNLLDCARVLSAVLMDSLFEATNKNTLLNFLNAKPDFTITPVGSPTERHPYLAVSHPNTDTDASFITDSTFESLFSKTNIIAADLQVGDHLYIYNHPLYKTFSPHGDWSGEHALVYDMGDRNYTTSSGFFFGGHGKEGTLYQFYSAFLQKLKTNLERVYKIAKIHLEFRQTGPITDGINFFSTGSVTVQTTTQGWRIFEYDVPFSYNDYEHGGTTVYRRRFLIGHEVGFPYTFWIDKEITAASFFANGSSKDPIIFQRKTTAPAASNDTVGYHPRYYDLRYVNHNNDVLEFYNLFDFSTGRLRINQITIEHLFNDPFITVPGTSNIITTQPKADTSALYLGYLINHGAIV
jgi:hypothetical protein